MNINIRAIHLDVGDATTEYINQKLQSLEKFVERFEENGEVSVDIEIIRSTQHHRHGDVYEIHANLSINGDILRAEETGEDVRVLVDMIKDTLKNEISKYREKVLD